MPPRIDTPPPSFSAAEYMRPAPSAVCKEPTRYRRLVTKSPTAIRFLIVPPPTDRVDDFLATVIAESDHPEIVSVQMDPSGRPDAWTRVKIVFADGSAMHIGAELAR